MPRPRSDTTKRRTPLSTARSPIQEAGRQPAARRWRGRGRAGRERHVQVHEPIVGIGRASWPGLVLPPGRSELLPCGLVPQPTGGCGPSWAGGTGGGKVMGHNLSAQLTSFVGREAELAQLEQLTATRRLVTLTGVGGCGKTRLAAQLGQRVAEAWPDGFWLVDLGSVGDPSLVPQLTAST